MTISGVTAANKVYDGTTAATLTGGAVSGVVGGETVTVVAGTGTFDSANVGTRAVTATGYALGGANAGNYVLAAQPTVPDATITALPLQLTGTRAYDGTATVAAGVLSIANNLDGANLMLTGSANLAGKDVGPQAVSTSARRPGCKARRATPVPARNLYHVTMDAAPAHRQHHGRRDLDPRHQFRQGIRHHPNRSNLDARGASHRHQRHHDRNLACPQRAGRGDGCHHHPGNLASLGGRGDGIQRRPVCQPAGPDGQHSPGTSTAASTGTTAATTQANELWIGGIGYRDSTPALSLVTRRFTRLTCELNQRHSDQQCQGVRPRTDRERHRSGFIRRHHQPCRHGLVRRDCHLQDGDTHHPRTHRFGSL